MKSLVTLEEAILPLVGIVPKIQENVAIVMKICQSPTDGLTKDESRAIMLYTVESEPPEVSLYYILNKTLHSGSRTNLEAWLLYLRLILNGLGRLQSFANTIYRVVPEDLCDKYSVGQKFIWWGFSSCTTRSELIESDYFLGKSVSRTIFEIKSISCKNISNHTVAKKEQEILLIPNTRFVVTECSVISERTRVIKLDEMIPTSPRINFTQTIVSKRLHNISLNATWSQTGEVIITDVKNPYGLAIDQEEDTVFIADDGNYRVIYWTPNDKKVRVLADRIGNDERGGPTDVLIDKRYGSLYVTDSANRRVIRLSLETNHQQKPETFIEDIDCVGLTIDDDSALYVCDNEKHAVRRFVAQDKKGTIVVAGNGPGKGLHQLNNPHYPVIDNEGIIYVSDWLNNRLVKWEPGAHEGSIVIGQDGNNYKIKQLSRPNGIVIDTNGTIYIADSENSRILRLRKNTSEAEVIIDEGQLKYPTALAFDRFNNLYVTDFDTHRVVRFLLKSSSK